MAVRKLKRLNQLFFGFVLKPDNADNLINIQIGNAKPFEDFHAVINFAKAETRAALQNFAAMIEERLNDFAQVHDARRTRRIEHIHIQRRAAFKVCDLEEAFHHHIRVDIFAFGFQNDTDIFGGLVSHIGESWRFFIFNDLGQLFNQARFLNLIRDFRDDDLIDPSPHIFFMPARADLKAALACLIGFEHGLIGLNDNPASR